MSERSIYLRGQAEKCTEQAHAVADPVAKATLRQMASGYTSLAAEIEDRESRLQRPPSLPLLRGLIAIQAHLIQRSRPKALVHEVNAGH